MADSFKVDLSQIKRMMARFDSPAIREQIERIPRQKAVAGIIGQAIADNFNKQGPGWKPLKFREGMALQKTGLLKKSVTTPGTKGNIYNVDGWTITWGTNLHYAGIHNRGGVISAKNAKALFIPITKKAERVGPLKDKAARAKSKLKYGIDYIFRKSVVIPARPFLFLSTLWKKNMMDYVQQSIKQIIQGRIMR